MPITIVDCRGLSGARRQHVEAAIVAAGRGTPSQHEAWVASDRFPEGLRVMITGPSGFDRMILFPVTEEPGMITERLREMMESAHRS